jgi:hypothetical protein
MRASTTRMAPAVVAMMASLFWSAGAWADGSLEYAVKAAYLVKFIPFIQWPDSALPAGAPFNICLLGPDPFGANLDRAAAGQKVGDHPLTVRRMAAPDPAIACEMLFVDTPDPSEGIAAAQGKPVVTVTDSDMHVHGIISFVVSDNHVRFDIDDDAAQAAGIVISSKLLDLARNVKRKGAP